MKKTETGTCSWKYPEWEFYKTRDKDKLLAEYALKFPTVEVDQWFWSLFAGSQPKLPGAGQVEQYKQSVPDDFTFAVKVPNSITLTHFYKKQTKGFLEKNPWFLSQDLFGSFLDSLNGFSANPLRLNFQFEYLNKQKMSGLSEFLESLNIFFAGISRTNAECYVEIRNPAWFRSELFDFFEKQNVFPVLLQGYYMDDIWQTAWKYLDRLPGKLMIRLHGRDRDGIEKISAGKWDRLVQQKDDEIEHIAKMIAYLEKQKKTISVYVNNHYEGSAPLTIWRLEEAVRRNFQ